MFWKRSTTACLVSAALAALVLATPAPAAASGCVGGYSKSLKDGSVKMNYSICTNTIGDRKWLTGTLYDTKENGMNACAAVLFGLKPYVYKTGSQLSIKTPSHSSSPKVTLANC